MDSSAYVATDKTLPVDFNGSSNLDLLTEVTYGEVGVAPMMEKSSTGRMSPVRGRTMKEYDQQISELKKENFDLKLRIYFMQERMNTKYNDENVIHTNIELNVEMEKHKQDLVEKQALLEKASETIDSLTTKYSEIVEKEVATIKQQCDEAVEKANQKVEDMEEVMDEMKGQLEEFNSQLKPELEEKTKQIDTLQANLEDRDRMIVELDDRIKEFKRDLNEISKSKNSQQLQFMDEVETLRTSLGRKDRDIQRLSVIVEDKTCVAGVTALERSHLKDEVEDTKRELDKLRQTCEKQNKDLDARQQMIGRLEDLLRQRQKDKDGLRKELEAKSESYTRCKGLIAKLVKDCQDKDEKIGGLEEDLKGLQDDLAKLKDAASESELLRQKAAAQTLELKQNLEKLVRTLGKREGELENFKDLLDKAQRSLNMSEAAVELLQKQLEKERCRCKEKVSSEGDDDDVRKLRRELDDLHTQLTDRDKQYQSKCDELDTIAQRLNINVHVHNDGNDQSEMLNKILDEIHLHHPSEPHELHSHFHQSHSHFPADPNELHSHFPTDSRQSNSHFPTNSQQSHSHFPTDSCQSNSNFPTDFHQSHSHFPTDSHLDNTDSSTSTLRHHSQTSPHQRDFEVFHNQDVDSHHQFPVVGKRGSRIPVRYGSSTLSTTSVPDDVIDDNSARQITELKGKVLNLQNTLKATEETVHCQTKKMKHYRNILMENGLLPRSRSNSVPCSLNKLNSSLPMDYRCNDSDGHSLFTDSASVRSPRCRSVSPRPVARRDEIDSTSAQSPRDQNTENINSTSSRSRQDQNMENIDSTSAQPRQDQIMEHFNHTSPLSRRGQNIENINSTSPRSRDQNIDSMSPRSRDQNIDSTSPRSRRDQNINSTSPRSREQNIDSTSPQSRDQNIDSTSSCSRRDQNMESFDPTVTDDLENISKENAKLKQQLDGYKRILKVFQGRNPGLESPPSGGQDVGPTPISSESASCLLDSWLNTLDNFLTDLSQSDQEGLLHLPTSSAEVAHLRRGLVQARGAIQTLSDTCLAGQDKLSEGRLSSEGRVSPDSGCSDNPSSTHNTMLRESLQNSHISSSISESGRERNRSGSDDLSYSGRDAGVDLSEFQLMDSVRKRAFSRDLTIDSTLPPVFSHDITLEDRATMPDAGTMPHSLRSRFESTFTHSFLSGNETLGDALGDISTTGRPSLLFTLDNTHNETSKVELKERMKTLEDLICVYQEKNAKQPGSYMDSLQELLNELCHLRRLLEDSIAHNEHLEKLLFELNTSSENTVQDLKFQLHQSYTIIQQKVKIISENEKLAKETSASLAKYRDNSAKDSAELEFCRGRVKSLEKELQDGKSMNTQLTSMCQQLKTAVEQYKKRCDQLEGDNKSHMDAVYRYKNKVKDLEDEMTKKTEDETTTDELKAHINVLETEAQHWIENESKYKGVLAESESQISQLSSDLDKVRNELTLQQHDITYLKGELEESRDTVEKQNQHLCEKNCIIDDINAELKEKNHILQEQNSLCQDLTSKMESLSTVNGKLSTQLEQQRLTCADYKRQIEKQNHQIKELKDGADHCIDRKAHDNMLAEKMKELQEAGRLRDKYLYNLKLTYKEFSRVKKELKESKRTCDETNILNDTLQTELKVREKLMDMKGSLLTDDAKHNMILQLLQELSRARGQMNKLLVQNESIKKKMTELIEQLTKNKGSDQATGGQCFGDVAMEINIKSSVSSETTELILGDPQTTPQDLFNGTGRMDILSASLPLRESTPGGPCSKNQQSRQSTESLPCNFNSSEKRDSGNEYFRSNKDETSGTYAPEVSTSTLMTEDLSLEDVSIKDVSVKDVSFKDVSVKDMSVKDVSLSSGHFSIPGPIYKQQITDQCLLYNVNDNPMYLAGLTQVRIDSDMRSLFAVGMIDHFEKLRKEASECDVILKGLATRVTQRLKVFAEMSATEMIKSVEYSTLKELSYAADNMRLCVDSQLSMIGCFWTSELPAPNEKGEFVNQKLINQNATLRDEICSLRSKLGRDRGGGAHSQLEEEELCRSLQSTLDVMTRARENLTSNISSNSSFNSV